MGNGEGGKQKDLCGNDGDAGLDDFLLQKDGRRDEWRI